MEYDNRRTHLALSSTAQGKQVYVQCGDWVHWYERGQLHTGRVLRGCYDALGVRHLDVVEFVGGRTPRLAQVPANEVYASEADAVAFFYGSWNTYKVVWAQLARGFA
jgi:hypothetical protein